jgi:hypothetical protein
MADTLMAAEVEVEVEAVDDGVDSDACWARAAGRASSLAVRAA